MAVRNLQEEYKMNYMKQTICLALSNWIDFRHPAICLNPMPWLIIYLFSLHNPRDILSDFSIYRDIRILWR